MSSNNNNNKNNKSKSGKVSVEKIKCVWPKELALNLPKGNKPQAFTTIVPMNGDDSAPLRVEMPWETTDEKGFTLNQWNKYTAVVQKYDLNAKVFSQLTAWWADFEKTVKYSEADLNGWEFKKLFSGMGESERMFVSWDRVYVDGEAEFKTLNDDEDIGKPDSPLLKEAGNRFMLTLEPRVWARVDDGNDEACYGCNFVVVGVEWYYKK